MPHAATLLGSTTQQASGEALSLLGCRVRAGFPGPADDHLDTDIDLHANVVKRPAATFFVRAEGDSMLGDGIHHCDLLVVDRSLEALPGRVIVIAVDGEFSPHVEVYSIDKSFVGFQGFDPAFLEARGHRVRQTVRQWTGIPVSVGFAPTRVLAKVANRAAKKLPAYAGVCKLEADSPANRALLRQLPVTELWGVARRTSERLALKCIDTAWQLPEALRRFFSRATAIRRPA